MYNRYTKVFLSITYLLRLGGLGPGQALPSFLLRSLSPLLVRRPTRIGASGPRLQGCLVLAQPAALQPLNQPQEDSLPGVPGEQSVDQPASRPHDLARHLDHRRAKRRKLHPQQRSLLSLVLGRVPRRDRCQQALQAFKLHDSEAITMYAQLLTRSSTGVVSAWTPLLSWAIRFS